MDLFRLGHEDRARDLLATYRWAGGDPGDDGLLAFFAAYRAWVRATVACERAAELSDDPVARGRQEDDARDLVDLGHRFAWRARDPRLIVVCGVSASGKTTLAERLAAAQRPPAPLLRPDPQAARRRRADRTRRRRPLHGGRPRGGLPGARPRGRRRASRGEAAIVDATFHREAERFAFEEGMGEGLTVPVVVECTAPPSLLLRRAEARAAGRHDASDADADVVLRQLGERDPLEGRWARSRLRLRTDISVDLQLTEVESFVDRHARA